MEDTTKTMETLIKLDEPEALLSTARDAAKRLFDVCSVILAELEAQSQPKRKEDSDISA